MTLYCTSLTEKNRQILFFVSQLFCALIFLWIWNEFLKRFSLNGILLFMRALHCKETISSSYTYYAQMWELFFVNSTFDTNKQWIKKNARKSLYKLVSLHRHPSFYSICFSFLFINTHGHACINFKYIVRDGWSLLHNIYIMYPFVSC